MRMTYRFSFFLLLFFLMGCSGSKPLVSRKPASVVKTEPGKGSTLAAKLDRGLQPGDQIRVTLPYNAELNATAVVQPDGFVDLPSLGLVKLGGLTVQQARSLLAIRYGRIVTTLELSLDVTRASPVVVYVGGEVAHPGTVSYTSELSLLSAIFRAGGSLPSAKLSEVVVLRQNGGGQPEMLRVDLRPVVKGKNEYADPVLLPYDIVIVPPSGIARVGQFVHRYVDGLLPLATITGFAWIYRIVVRGY